MPSTILSDNGVTSGTAGIKTTGSNDGALALQTTTAGGAATTALEINTSQQVSFTAGTAAAPAITPTGDTNTGIFFPAADTIAFAEGGAEAMRIDSSGRLLVGTTTARSDFFNTTTVVPRFQVELAASDNLNRFISVTSNNSDTGGGTLLLAKSRGTTVGAVTIVQNDDQIGAVSFQAADGVNLVEAARIEAKVDGTPGSDDMPASLRFYTTADGAASTTERARIPAAGGFQCVNSLSVGNATPTTSGAGITFPATQSASTDANTLDDYEEGSWTPSLGGNTTYSVQSGTYVKIGKVVTVNFSLTVSTIGTGSVNTISGLPFSSAVQGTGLVGYFSNLFQAWGSLGFFTEGTTLRNISLTTGSTGQNVDKAIFGNGTRIDGCSITYIV